MHIGVSGDQMVLKYYSQTNTVELLVRDEDWSRLEARIMIGHVAHLFSKTEIKDVIFQIRMPKIDLDVTEEVIEHALFIFRMFGKFYKELIDAGRIKKLQYLLSESISIEKRKKAFEVIKFVLEENNLSEVAEYGAYKD